MVSFNAIIEKYKEHAEKTGWTYVIVPADVAQKINPGVKKGYRVKGKLDKYSIKGVSIMPVGGGDFMIPINKEMRTAIKKRKGESIKVQIEFDPDEKKISDELLECLKDDPRILEIFQTMPVSHQRYYSNWVETAKTEPTKAKRIAKIMVGLSKGLSFGETMRLDI